MNHREFVQGLLAATGLAALLRKAGPPAPKPIVFDGEVGKLGGITFKTLYNRNFMLAGDWLAPDNYQVECNYRKVSHLGDPQVHYIYESPEGHSQRKQLLVDWPEYEDVGDDPDYDDMEDDDGES